MATKERSRKKSRSHDEGLWIVTEEESWIPVKKTLLKAENITPQPVIRKGKPYIEGQSVELVEPAQWPVFRDDTASLVKKMFMEQGFKPEMLFPKDPIAESRLDKLIESVLTVTQEIPLASYKMGSVDKTLKKVQEIQKYQVVGVNEKSGKEIVRPFPDLQMTHQIFEKDEKITWVFPRVYWDLWLQESIHAITAVDDVGRFELWKLAQKLNDYPFSRTDPADGKVILDKKGKPTIIREEGMIIKEGYVAQSGSSQQYHALLMPVRIVEKDVPEQFVFLMKLSQTIIRYTDAMRVPLPGEVPVTVSKEQKPLVMASVAEMLKAVVG